MTGDFGYSSRIRDNTTEIFGDLIIPTDDRCCYTITLQWTDRDINANPIIFLENFRCVTHEEFGNGLSIDFSIRNSAPMQFEAAATYYQIEGNDDLPTEIFPAIDDLLPPPSIHASIVNLSTPDSLAVFQIY